MTARRSIVSLMMAALLAGCASTGPLLPPTSALQLRQIQTHRFETPDTKLVMRAVLQGLQDAGFQLKQAEAELGLVVATRESARKRSKGLRIAILVTLPTLYPWLARGASTTLEEVTGTVNRIDDHTRVRFTGQIKLLQNGHVEKVRPIDDGPFFQDLLSRIDKALFLEQEKL